MVSTGLLERYKQVVLTGLPFTNEHQVEREGADPYWIVMQVVKLGDGVAVTTRDVTEERAALHQIANLNEFTQSMIENAPFSIIATDPAGTVTAMNPAAESLTLYRKHELIGQHSMVMLHDPGEMSARAVQLSRTLHHPVQAGFNSLVAKPSEGQTDEHEWTYVRKDGSRIWVNLAMTALKSEDEQDRRLPGYCLRHHRAKEADRIREPPGPPRPVDRAAQPGAAGGPDAAGHSAGEAKSAKGCGDDGRYRLLQADQRFAGPHSGRPAARCDCKEAVFGGAANRYSGAHGWR